ncbi:hypothetical protein MPSEU_000112600 [Mayamaea pseudoterrestris]|nr:hypothetical protein MPSEU_000112600 [Mayamaea pseudoterrestris]
MVLVAFLMEGGGSNEESGKRKSTRADQPTQQHPRNVAAEALEGQYGGTHPLAEWSSMEGGYSSSSYPASYAFEGMAAASSAYQQETEGMSFDMAYRAHMEDDGHLLRHDRKEEGGHSRLQLNSSDETKDEDDDRKPAARTSNDRLMEQLERSFPDVPHQEDSYFGDLPGALGPAPPYAAYPPMPYAAMQHPAEESYPTPYRSHHFEAHPSHSYGIHSPYQMIMLGDPLTRAMTGSDGQDLAARSSPMPLTPGQAPYATAYDFPTHPAPSAAEARANPPSPETAIELTADRLYPSDEELSRAKHERDRKAIVKWYDRFRELISYKGEHGNTAVPQKYPRNKQLGSWVNKMRDLERQRKQGKHNFLNDRMWENLKLIGFVSAKPKGDPLWMLRYNQLKEYYHTTHHSNVPTKYAQNRALGRWVSTQRLSYRLYSQGQLSSMTPERVRLLEELSFVWDAAPDRDGSAEEDRNGDGRSE